MYQSILTSLALVLTLGSSVATAMPDIKYVKNDGGKIVEVQAAQVESACGKNFIFRESHKEEVAAYLRNEIVKAAFQGLMSPSFDTVLSSLKASSGTCAWVTTDEFGKW